MKVRRTGHVERRSHVGAGSVQEGRRLLVSLPLREARSGEEL